jgi:hypothetical protein
MLDYEEIRLVKNLILLSLLYSWQGLATDFVINKGTQDFYKKHLPDFVSYKILKIDDPISDKPINTSVIKVFGKDGKTSGYIREVVTTTGCNSACLPVIFTLFYDNKKSFLKIKSKIGLTKKNHAMFTPDDYSKLDWVLVTNPQIFKSVGYPTQMVDAITGATKVEYRDHVVKEAAYSTLRINLYHQHTLTYLKSISE